MGVSKDIILYKNLASPTRQEKSGGALEEPSRATTFEIALSQAFYLHK